jgi:hypothetical protein
MEDTEEEYVAEESPSKDYLPGPSFKPTEEAVFFLQCNLRTLLSGKRFSKCPLEIKIIMRNENNIELTNVLT